MLDPAFLVAARAAGKESTPIAAKLQALWDAGLSDWERYDDPDAVLREIRGEETAMSWEAWGDPPDPPPMKVCLNCDGMGTEYANYSEATPKLMQCGRCHGDGKVEDADDDDIYRGEFD